MARRRPQDITHKERDSGGHYSVPQQEIQKRKPTNDNMWQSTRIFGNYNITEEKVK